MKYDKVDNIAWQPQMYLIEALAKVELLEKGLEKTPFKVTGVLIGAKDAYHEDARITEAMLRMIGKATGLTVQVNTTNDDKKISFVIETRE